MAEYKNPAMRPGRWEEYQKGLAGRGPADADLWTAQNFPEFMTSPVYPQQRLQTTQVGSAPRGGGSSMGSMVGMEYLNERNPLRRRKPTRASFGTGGSAGGAFRGAGGGFGGGGWSMGG
jgi:hypothetical protein